MSNLVPFKWPFQNGMFCITEIGKNGLILITFINPYWQISGKFLRPFYWKTHPDQMLHIIYGFSQKIQTDEFSSKTALENENFRKISGWVFHNFPIRVNTKEFQPVTFSPWNKWERHAFWRDPEALTLNPILNPKVQLSIKMCILFRWT